MLARVEKKPASKSPGAALTESVQSVLLQFIIRDGHLVPGWMWRAAKPAQHAQPGEKIILPHEFVGLWAFVHELLDARYALQDAYALDRDGGAAAIRFVYARKVPDDAPDTRAREVLRELCKKSTWQVCAFLNAQGEGSGISINCNSQANSSLRQPAAYLRVLEGQFLIERA